LHTQLDAAERILEDAQRRRDGRLALAALKEGREVLSSIGRALGLITDAAAMQVTIDVRRQAVAAIAQMSPGALEALAWPDDAIDAEVRQLPDGTLQNDVPALPAPESA
jgi:hypothetical protein